MASQSWGQLIAAMPIQGQSYASFTTAKSLLTSTASESSKGLVILPSNFFQRGASIEIDAEFSLTNQATPGTLVLQVMLTAASSIIAFTTGNIAMCSAATTALPVRCSIRLTCQKEGNGVTAQLMGQAVLFGQNIGMVSGALNAAGMGMAIAPATTAALGNGFDSTLAQTLDFWGGFSTSSSTNAIQLNQYRVISWGNTAV